MSDTFRTKLGTNKGLPKSRIWIEGQRLVDHGFTRPATYSRHTTKTGSLILTLDPDGKYKVAGKGDHPIIDITGKAIAESFGAMGDYVLVTYQQGKIIIRGESE